jgi:ribonuclease D
LREAFLEYAAEDVEYLLPAFEQLGERLDREGRLDWARQDSCLLLDPQLYDVGADQAIDRLKGARNFQGRKRVAAARLAAWREDEAVRKNRPRQWILRDNVLLEIANNLPASEEQLAAIQGLSPRLVNRAGKNLLEVVNSSGAGEDGYRPPSPRDNEKKALLREAQAIVARCAQELGLAAETVASRRELAALIDSGDEQSRVLSGWRRDVIGDDLLELM